MVTVPSTMLPLGTRLPEFSLPNTVDGTVVSSSSLLGRERPAVVAFVCNHCPYVVHIRDELARFGRWCDERGVPVVAISSNDAVGYPQDGPDKMKEEAERVGYGFPYLYDESQDVAKAFRAACTPEFYVFDATGRLAYRGQFDRSRPNKPVPVTGEDVRAAVEALLSGGRPADDQVPSIGCNIKWKKDGAPEYFG